MTSYSRGSIVLVPFPFTDLSTIKQRPALIISSNRFNARQEDVIIVAITSNVAPYRGRSGNYLVTGQEQVVAGLPKEGVVRASKIVTIDKRMIRRTLGVLPLQAVDQVVKNIRAIIS